MTLAIAFAALLHLAALAGVLAAARYDCALVDEHGRFVTDDWYETTVPVAARAEIRR